MKSSEMLEAFTKTHQSFSGNLITPKVELSILSY